MGCNLKEGMCKGFRMGWIHCDKTCPHYKIDEAIVGEVEEKILFPFQYMEKYLLGEMDLDVACDSTMEECYRLIEEYVEKHNLKA